MIEKTPENIEAVPKLEWGQKIGPISQYTGIDEITKLNESLPEGEKKWRLPTIEELVAEFKKTGSTPTGFQGELYEGEFYWSGTTHPSFSDHAYLVYMGNGSVYHFNKDDADYYVRPVRDVA